MRIGQLAAEFELNPKTIRYYEELGLIPDPERSPSGYRLYHATARDRLEFILKAKTLGLALEEIAEILAVRDRGEPPCRHVVTLLDGKIAAVDRQIQSLRAFRRELITLRNGATEGVEANGGICRIIEHHTPLQSHEGTAAARGLQSSGKC